MSHLPFVVDQHQPVPAIEGVFGKDWCMDLWREDRLPPQTREPADAPIMTNAGAQVSCLDLKVHTLH